MNCTTKTKLTNLYFENFKRYAKFIFKYKPIKQKLIEI